jgi:hypothetical protein
MVVVEIEAESRGRGRWFSSSYGQPLKWGELSENETRLEFRDMIYFPFDRYPDLARIERFEPGGAAQLSEQEEPAVPRLEDVEGTEPRTFILFVEGTVRIKKANGELFKADPGMDLEIGDSIETGADGKVTFVLADTAVIRVHPETVIVIPEDKSNTKKKVGFIEMVRGVLWARAKKDRDSLKVATPNAVCGVRGTEFEVSYKNGVTCVEGFEGTVWLAESPDAAKKVINAGQKSCIPEGGQSATASSIGGFQLSGKWRSNFGLMTLTQDGSNVSGSYTHDSGKIEGKLEGNILRGTWSESPSYKAPRDAGGFEFIFSDDAKKFTGKWRSGFDKQGWDGSWSGTKE